MAGPRGRPLPASRQPRASLPRFDADCGRPARFARGRLWATPRRAQDADGVGTEVPEDSGPAAGVAAEHDDSPFVSTEDDDDGVEADDPTLFFGGITREREQEPEETEPMRVASRINEALALRRSPKTAPLALPETGWYDELGIAPTATQEELLLNYLEHAEETEEKLAYLLESGSDDEDDYDEKEAFGDDDKVDEEGVRAGDVPNEDESVSLQPSAATLAEATGTTEEEEEVQTEAERVALEFVRMSNLYQILSVPQLRRIYDSGGVEALAQRVPQLHKGLLEPERVLKMARGQKFAYKEKVSLLLRREPRQPSFQRYQATNSIKQVLRRMTDVFRVWCFKSGESLKHREGSIYTELPEICVFGRVNSGKSSLIQHLFSAGKMRRKRLATASQWPGKTQGINVYCVNRRFTVADLPGYGSGTEKHESAQAVHFDWKKKWQPLVKEYISTTQWLRAAIYVHDIGKDVTMADSKTIQMFRKAQIPVLLVFTKDDKVDSDTHRLSRVKWIRQGLGWYRNLPHAHYTTRRGGYGQVFKNMLGTMMLGLVATETREDAFQALKTELADIFFDYRDKWVPRPRTRFGKVPKEKKVRTYPNEDKPYTDEDLEEEERAYDRRERQRIRDEQEAAGYRRTVKDDVEEQGGTVLTPKERRRRWAEMLQAVKQGELA